MGEIVEVDVAQLRAMADRVLTTADQLATTRCSRIDPDDLPGSAVGDIAAPALVAARLSDVVATMRAWAAAAQVSADAVERADRRNGEHLDV